MMHVPIAVFGYQRVACWLRSVVHSIMEATDPVHRVQSRREEVGGQERKEQSHVPQSVQLMSSISFAKEAIISGGPQQNILRDIAEKDRTDAGDGNQYAY